MKYLIEYYSPLMLGNYLDKEKIFKIKFLKFDQLENDRSRYLIRACTKRDWRGFLLFKEISSIAKELDLPSPEIILSNDI